MHGLRTSETQHRQSSSMVTITKSEWNWSLVAVLSRREISLKCDKIGPRLLLMTNRKLPTRFWLVPKSMTLDDLEGYYALCFKIHAFSEPTVKIWMKIDLHYQRQRCSWILWHSFWQFMAYADIHVDSLDRGHQTRVGLLTMAIFSVFADNFFGNFTDKASIIM